jgi:hypothetical protein
MDRNCSVLANSHWEMLLKVIGHVLVTAERVMENRWEMPKGYWMASGQFLEVLGKPLGNAQIPTLSQ